MGGCGNDYMQYKRVLKTKSLDEIKVYYQRHPNGWFLEEVKVQEVLISKDIEVARTFIKEWPQSEYLQDVDSIRIALWDAEIEYFNQFVAAEFSDSKAVDFFRNLLTYMRDNKQSQISLHLEGQTNLLNFEEHTEEVRNAIDIIHELSDNRIVSKNMLGLTSNYSEGNLQKYEKILSNSIENSFENILKDNFIKVNTHEVQRDVEGIPRSYKNEFTDDRENNELTPLTINIQYEIINQTQEGLENYPGLEVLPVIWTYTSNDIFQSYLLGISIKFQFNLSVPGRTNYEFNLECDPSSEANDIEDIAEGYEIMTEQTFIHFADSVATNFGIKNSNNPVKHEATPFFYKRPVVRPKVVKFEDI